MTYIKNNLMVQFSVASFIAMEAIALVLIMTLSYQVQSDAVQALIGEAVGSAHGRLLNALTPEDLETPMHGRRYDDFHSFVQTAIVSERTARVKLWGKDGTIIYSDDPTAVGQRYPNKNKFVDAMRGENAFEIKVPKDVDNAHEQHLGTLMEVYTPIVFPGTTTPQGVLEIYQYYAPTARQIAHVRTWILAAVGVGFVVLYGSLITIVWRGWHIIQRQQAALTLAHTDLERAYSSLRETNGQLTSEVADRRRAEAELNATVVQLERSNRELQDFAYVASHDLQEPLRKIRAFGDRLTAQYAAALGDRGRDYLARMQQAAARMQTLIEDLLTFSRVTTKAHPFRPVDLTQIAREVVADLEVRLEQSGARVDLESLPVIEADPLQMRQLLQNLLSNALKFHQPDEPPIVTIRSPVIPRDDVEGDTATPTPEQCQLLVQDNGIGFDEKYLDRIFVPFQRLHGRSTYEGTGIGLAVCRKIAERHGGRITATSTPGQGATFIITLPVTQPKGENCA